MCNVEMPAPDPVTADRLLSCGLPDFPKPYTVWPIRSTDGGTPTGDGYRYNACRPKSRITVFANTVESAILGASGEA